MTGVAQQSRRLLLRLVRFTLHPGRRVLPALILCALGYGLAVIGWHAQPIDLTLAQGRGLSYLLGLAGNAATGLLPTSVLTGSAGFVRGWQYASLFLFYGGLALLLLPVPFQKVRNALLVWLTKGLPDQTIIIGSDDFSRAMLKRMYELKQPVLWATHSSIEEPPGSLRDIPRIEFSQDSLDALWSESKLARVALLDADSEMNQARAELWLNLAQSRAQESTRRPRLRLITRLENERLRAVWASEAGDRSARHGIQLQCFSLFALQARALFRSYSPDRFSVASEESDLRVAICSLNEAGRQLLTQLARLCHFQVKRNLHVYAIGGHVAREIEHYWRMHPELENFLHVEAMVVDLSSPSAAKQIASQLYEGDSGVHAMYLTADPSVRSGDRQALALELEKAILALSRQPPPIYRLGGGERLDDGAGRGRASWEEATTDSIDLVGLLDVGLDALLDVLPRAIHQSYLSHCLNSGEEYGARPALVDWDRLATDFVEDNRSLSDHFWIKAHGLDAEIASGAGPSVAALSMSASELEDLAIAEHERWSACRRSLGWRHAQQRDDSNRLHPDLVDWNQLSEPVRDKDRNAVAQFPSSLARHGYQVLRLERVVVAAEVSDVGLLLGPKRSSKDPLRLWVVRIGSVEQCQLAYALVAVGEHVEMHVVETLLRWTGGSYVMARQLLDRAWRIVVLSGDERQALDYNANTLTMGVDL